MTASTCDLRQLHDERAWMWQRSNDVYDESDHGKTGGLTFMGSGLYSKAGNPSLKLLIRVKGKPSDMADIPTIFAALRVVRFGSCFILQVPGEASLHSDSTPAYQSTYAFQ